MAECLLTDRTIKSRSLRLPDSLKTTNEVKRMMHHRLKKDESLDLEARSDPAAQNDPDGPRAETEAGIALRTERKPGGGANPILMTRTAGGEEKTGRILMTRIAEREKRRGKRRKDHVLRLAEKASHTLIMQMERASRRKARSQNQMERKNSLQHQHLHHPRPHLLSIQIMTVLREKWKRSYRKVRRGANVAPPRWPFIDALCYF